MKLVFFTHPAFLESQSMPRFANMLVEGMQKRGCKVEQWTAEPLFYKLPFFAFGKKWLGYIDQYVVFPIKVKRKVKNSSPDTLFVFTDNALGPWVPYVSHRPHVIHCHDFMAQQSAKGEIVENPTSFTGRIYQQYIRDGYRQGKCFISVSKKTQDDLHSFLEKKPLFSKVIYNGLNRQINLVDSDAARLIVSEQTGWDMANGYILHVGGNQWYKNRKGLVAAYTWCRQKEVTDLPLVLVGSTPNTELASIIASSPFVKDIIVVTNGNDEFLDAAYCGASFLFFPSLNEGFGWPIAEAMYCGCKVLTTNVAPMTEVGGNAAFYIPRMPTENTLNQKWYQDVADAFKIILTMDKDSTIAAKAAGQKHVSQFDAQTSVDAIVSCYEKILSTFKSN